MSFLCDSAFFSMLAKRENSIEADMKETKLGFFFPWEPFPGVPLEVLRHMALAASAGLAAATC